MKVIKENEYFKVGGVIFQHLIIDGKSKIVASKKVILPKKNIPTKEEVIEYFLKYGYLASSGEKFYDGYSAADWKDSNGKDIKNWKQKAQFVWFKENNKQQPTSKPKTEGFKFFQ